MAYSTRDHKSIKKRVEEQAPDRKTCLRRDIKDDLYKAIIQNAQEGFIILSLEGDILDVNDAFCKMNGYSRGELLSMRIYELGTKEGVPRDFNFSEEMKRHKAMGGATFETQHRHKNGEAVDLMVSSKYLDIGGGIFFSFHSDITEKNRMIQKLKESEDRYRALIELGNNIGEAVIMLQDIDGREGVQVFVSERWCNMTGYSTKELLGMSFFDLVSGKYKQVSLERHRKKISGESIPKLHEMSIIRKDGIEVPIEITSAHSL
jgi:PAS domain S-box-containing protein